MSKGLIPGFFGSMIRYHVPAMHELSQHFEIFYSFWIYLAIILHIT